jgi:hypothetical protein
MTILPYQAQEYLLLYDFELYDYCDDWVFVWELN